MNARVTTLLCAAIACGCPIDNGPSETDGGSFITQAESMTDPSPADDSSSSGAQSSTGDGTAGSGPDRCTFANPCPQGEFCVAPYADNERGPFACVDSCVEPADATRWCFDDAGCCDPDATCTDRGYCVVTGDTSTGASGSTDSGSTESSSGGSSDGSSSDSGSSGSTESSSTG